MRRSILRRGAASEACLRASLEPPKQLWPQRTTRLPQPDSEVSFPLIQQMISEVTSSQQHASTGDPHAFVPTMVVGDYKRPRERRRSLALISTCNRSGHAVDEIEAPLLLRRRGGAVTRPASGQLTRKNVEMVEELGDEIPELFRVPHGNVFL
jgi:hypothetical protein